MNARAEITTAKPVGSALDDFRHAMPVTAIVQVLRLLAESGAKSWDLYQLDLCDVVDVLQEFAERTGAVSLIGQDACQLIISEPFAHYRTPAEQVEPEQIPLSPVPEPPRREYRTPKATADAFLYLARTATPEYLAAWLERHPLDVPYLRNVWKEKCTAR